MAIVTNVFSIFDYHAKCMLALKCCSIFWFVYLEHQCRFWNNVNMMSWKRSNFFIDVVDSVTMSHITSSTGETPLGSDGKKRLSVFPRWKEPHLTKLFHWSFEINYNSDNFLELHLLKLIFLWKSASSLQLEIKPLSRFYTFVRCTFVISVLDFSLIIYTKRILNTKTRIFNCSGIWTKKVFKNRFLRDQILL